MAEYYKSKGGWLKWILIYLVIGGIVYFAVYYFYLKNKNPYSGSTTPTYNSAPASATSSPYSY